MLQRRRPPIRLNKTCDFCDANDWYIYHSKVDPGRGTMAFCRPCCIFKGTLAHMMWYWGYRMILGRPGYASHAFVTPEAFRAQKNAGQHSNYMRRRMVGMNGAEAKYETQAVVRQRMAAWHKRYGHSANKLGHPQWLKRQRIVDV